MLEVTDQLFPPAERDALTAELTVEHLRRWVERVDAVLHFVGAKAGAVCKVPEGELPRLVGLLGPASKELLRDLAATFVAGGAQADQITYTHLEGVMAIATGKQPFLLWLEVRDEDVEPVQRLYRKWLRERYLSGRDRCAAASAEELVQAAHRKLAEWNERTKLERLARSTQEVTLWETVFELSQPEIDRRSVEFRWNEVLRYQADSAVDWIQQRTDCGEPTSALIHRATGHVPAWLIPTRDGVGMLSLKDRAWTFKFQDQPGQLRAVCHDGGAFWTLSESSDLKGYRLARADQTAVVNVAGLTLHHFGRIHLWFANETFHAGSGGQVWRLASPASSPGVQHVTAKPTLMPTEVADSGVVPQFPRPASFPFRRHFRGETHDYVRLEGDASKPEADVQPAPWALVAWQGRLHHLVFQAGDFTDAFKTVDVTMAGRWDVLQVLTKEAMLWLVLESAGEKRRLPLFPERGMGTMDYTHEVTGKERVALLRRVAQMDLLCVQSLGDSSAAPYCFVARDVAVTQKVETRLRVWLIPALPSSSIILDLRKLLCGVEVLPDTPVRSHCTSATEVNAFLQPPWWRLLWEECHLPWSPG